MFMKGTRMELSVAAFSPPVSPNSVGSQIKLLNFPHSPVSAQPVPSPRTPHSLQSLHSRSRSNSRLDLPSGSASSPAVPTMHLEHDRPPIRLSIPNNQMRTHSRNSIV